MAIAQDQSFQLFTCRNSKVIRNLDWLLPFSEDLWNRVVTSWLPENTAVGYPRRVSLVGVHEGDGASTVTHGLAHYLSNPAVHSSLFRAVIPEFKLKDLAAAQKLAATGEWTGVGGEVAKMVDAKKADLLAKLEALGAELLSTPTARDVLLLVKLLKRLRTISTGDEP